MYNITQIKSKTQNLLRVSYIKLRIPRIELTIRSLVKFVRMVKTVANLVTRCLITIKVPIFGIGD